jgi:hypothetical protein
MDKGNFIKSYFIILFCLFISQSAFSQSRSKSSVAYSIQQKEKVREILQKPEMERLYSKTYYSLLDRLNNDGFLPESLTGAYSGMYPRTSGPFVLLMIETGRYKEAEANIKCVLDAVAQNDMERIPRVVGKEHNKYIIIDDQFQIDAQAHVILAWARLALKRGHTQFEDDTWDQVKMLMRRTCDRTFFQYGGWSIEPGLVRNIAFEHSKEGRMWDVFDLLTQSFVGAAMKDMIKIAERHNSPYLVADWNKKIAILSTGIKTHMVSDYYGAQAYVEMFIPNGNGGVQYNGLGWVTLSPIAAGWEGVDHQILKNTVKIMNEKLLKHSNGVVWMPTDGYPDGRFSNEIIGKGMAWEIDFSRSENDYKRICQILDLILTVNADKPLYLEGAWLEGNGKTLSNIISDDDLVKMKTSAWKVKDAGNGEQTAWWCWAIARLRKSVGLSAEPKR